jgi:glyoxylase-like metal-dependent hydrolase (beta-lactamase superfamily II)
MVAGMIVPSYPKGSFNLSKRATPRLIAAARATRRVSLSVAFCLAWMFSLQNANASGPTSASATAKFHIFTSEDDRFFYNSVVVEGRAGLLLIDAQLTRSNALKVLEMIHKLDTELKLVYITHEHADHFLGLEVFKNAFPNVKIVTNSKVADRIDGVYAEKIAKWQGLLGPKAASSRVEITRFDGDHLDFEGLNVELRSHRQGDTSENSYVWFPNERVAVVGDIAVDQMHAYTVETIKQSRTQWMRNLEELENLKPEIVIPGHSQPHKVLDADSAICFTKGYLAVFEEELARSKSGVDLKARMKRRYPDAGLFFGVERTAAALFKD